MYKIPKFDGETLNEILFSKGTRWTTRLDRAWEYLDELTGLSYDDLKSIIDIRQKLGFPKSRSGSHGYKSRLHDSFVQIERLLDTVIENYAEQNQASLDGQLASVRSSDYKRLSKRKTVSMQTSTQLIQADNYRPVVTIFPVSTSGDSLALADIESALSVGYRLEGDDAWKFQQAMLRHADYEGKYFAENHFGTKLDAAKFAGFYATVLSTPAKAVHLSLVDGSKVHSSRGVKLRHGESVIAATFMSGSRDALETRTLYFAADSVRPEILQRAFGAYVP